MDEVLAAQRLLEALQTDDAAERREAIHAVVKTPASLLSKAPLNLLLQAVGDQDGAVRDIVAAALGNRQDRTALGTLIDCLLKDPQAGVRSSSARALGKLRDPNALTALRSALLSDVYEVAEEAARAVLIIGGPNAISILIEMLSHPNGQTRRAAAVQLSSISDPAASSALLVSLSDSDAIARRLSTSGLRVLGNPTVVPALKIALEDKDPRVRSAALVALEMLSGAAAMSSILTCWVDDDKEVYATVRRFMGRYASSNEVRFLIEALHDSRPTKRAGAVHILGKLRSRDSIDSLMAALQDADGRVRLNAAEALGRIGPPFATPGLTSALKSPDREVRYAAAVALGAEEYSNAVPALLEALGDTDALIRATVAISLGVIGGPASLPALQQLVADDATYKSFDLVLHEPVADDATYSGGRVLNEPAAPDSRPEKRPTYQSEFDGLAKARTLDHFGSGRVSTAAKQAIAEVKTAQALKRIRFAACYPREAVPNTWYAAHVYLFESIAADLIAADAKNLLANHISEYRIEEDVAKVKLKAKTVITVRPRLKGFEFNPEYQSVAFCEPWHRLDFRLRANEAYLRKTPNGVVTITINEAVIADIPISIYVQSAEKPLLDARTSARLELTPPSGPYQSIFCSYSHEDSAVVRRVERAYRALGMTYLRDSVTLKSGQNWSEELLGMIKQADVFQLFWSEHAAASTFVAREWRCAESLGREVARFIRPVYWKQPMPSPPPELAHVHFAYTPDI